MARGRFLNKTVTTDEKVAKLTAESGPWAALFHHRCIAFLDRNGNLRADKHFLKAAIFPLDDGVSPDDCRQFAVQLATNGLAREYVIAGIPYLKFDGFQKNQINFRPEKEKPEFPEPQENQYVAYLPSNGRPVGDQPQPVPAKNAPLSESVSGSRSESELTPTESSDLPEPKSEPPVWMQEILTQWNQMASELGYSKIDKITKERADKLRKRKKEPSFDFTKIIQTFRNNKPCGYGESDWKPDFDYVIRSEQTYTKILEGAFKSNGNTKQRAGNLTPSGAKF